MSTFHQQNIYKMKMVQLPLVSLRTRDYLTFTTQCIECIEYFCRKNCLGLAKQVAFHARQPGRMKLGQFFNSNVPTVSQTWHRPVSRRFLTVGINCFSVHMLWMVQKEYLPQRHVSPEWTDSN